MISLLLVDAELERVPDICQEDGGPQVSEGDRELRGMIVLDSYLHGHLMEGLEGARRRGRPDIVHSFLLLAQGSAACREGRLRAFVHTRADEAIMVGPRYRPDPSYAGFLREMEALLTEGELGTGQEGLVLREGLSLEGLLDEISPDKVLALSPHGERVELRQALASSALGHVAVLIGGFPEGDYRSPVYQLAHASVSLGEDLLTVPDVTARVLSALP